MTLADLLIDLGAPGKGAPPSMIWMAEWLPDADRRALTRDDLARIDAYAGAARDLHELLPAALPLARPVWFEAAIIAAAGTEMTMGYGAAPADGGLDIGWACYAPAHGRIIGPLGPARVTSTGMRRPTELSADSWRELQVAAGIILRALLLRQRAGPR